MTRKPTNPQRTKETIEALNKYCNASRELEDIISKYGTNWSDCMSGPEIDEGDYINKMWASGFMALNATRALQKKILWDRQRQGLYSQSQKGQGQLDLDRDTPPVVTPDIDFVHQPLYGKPDDD